MNFKKLFYVDSVVVFVAILATITSFTVIAATPRLAILSPNGGETFLAGSVQNITFQSTYLKEPVVFQLYRNDVFVETIGNGTTGGDGQPIDFSWQIPTSLTPGSGYKIYVAFIAKEITDFSDAPFSVVTPTPIISSVVPTSVVPGAMVTVYGSNFNNTSIVRYEDASGVSVNAFSPSYVSEDGIVLRFVASIGTVLSNQVKMVRVENDNGTHKSNAVNFAITTPVQSSALITGFWAKDPNPINRSVTLIWNASDVTDASLEVVCNSGSIQFTTDKGNTPSCEKGGVWSWYGQTNGSIIVTPSNNTQTIRIPFKLILSKNGVPTNQTQTIYITFPALSVDSNQVLPSTVGQPLLAPQQDDFTIQALLKQIQVLQDQINALKTKTNSTTAVTQPISRSVNEDESVVVNTCLTISNSLKYRSKDILTGGEVSALQDFLQARGYIDSGPTGFFGLLTLKAVKKFQGDNGISPTGFVGQVTKAKIYELSC